MCVCEMSLNLLIVKVITYVSVAVLLSLVKEKETPLRTTDDSIRRRRGRLQLRLGLGKYRPRNSGGSPGETL